MTDCPTTEPRTLHSRLWAEFGEMLSPNEYAAIERIVAEAAQRDAPRAERFDRSWWHYADDCPATPRAEGLDVERLRDILDEAEGDGIIGPDYTPQLLTEYIIESLSRPSDERVPESEKPR